ncbi:MAG: restriction endonuclease subunit S [Chitinophagaceae bacterium]
MSKVGTYNKYKHSGLNWLGDVPQHWEVLRVKDIVQRIGSGVTPLGGSEVYVDNGITFIRSQNVYDDGLRLDDVSFITNEVHKKMKSSQLKPNDILINITGASIGRTCIVPSNIPTANINQHIIYLRFKPKYVPFIANYFKTISIKDYINLIQAGTSKEALNLGQTLNTALILPPLTEQTQIANYLDTKTQAIDKKINLLTTKIEYYKELRKTIINNAVTKGLDKNVKLKESELGLKPSHWTISRLKEVSKTMSSGATPLTNIDAYYEDGIVNWVNTGDLNDGIVESCQYKISQLAINDYPNLKVNKPGTLMIAMYGATIGKIGLLNIYATTNQACCCINFNKHNFSKFYFYWFLAYKQFMISLSVGGTQPNVGQGIIGKMLVAVPPIKEQTEIATYLDAKTNTIDKITTNLQTQIETLKELRKTLINDVVTGKVKVN